MARALPKAPLSRRSFLRGTAAGAAALTAAGSGAFSSRAQASDWSGETLRFMIINPHAGSIKPLSEGFTELTGATVEGGEGALTTRSRRSRRSM